MPAVEESLLQEEGNSLFPVILLKRLSSKGDVDCTEGDPSLKAGNSVWL